MNLLFICSRNQWRSRTAETLFKNIDGYEVRSAGTEPSARIRISEKLLAWAEIVFVMEKKHKQRIQQKFPQLAVEKEFIILDIPDEYEYMDEDLVIMLQGSLTEIMGDDAFLGQ
jgi:predicted protein tyrosine phosphatase